MLYYDHIMTELCPTWKELYIVNILYLKVFLNVNSDTRLFVFQENSKMWAAARICQINLKPAFKSTVPVLKNTITANSVCFVDAGCAVRHQALRKFTNSRYDRISHVARRTRKADPETAFTIGRAAVSGAGAFGLAALCYYGLGLSSRNGIVEKSMYVSKIF